MSGEVAHARGRLAADEDGEGAQGDDIGWSDADRHVADAGCRHSADQDGDAAWGQDGSADVGDGGRRG